MGGVAIWPFSLIIEQVSSEIYAQRPCGALMNLARH